MVYQESNEENQCLDRHDRYNQSSFGQPDAMPMHNLL